VAQQELPSSFVKDKEANQIPMVSFLVIKTGAKGERNSSSPALFPQGSKIPAE